MTDPTNQDAKRNFWVLVVEDEFFIAMEIEDALRDAGYSVLGPASSVEEALDLLPGKRPDAAILDFHLGGEKVTPVALRLQALGIPFFLASASSSADLAWNVSLLTLAISESRPI